MAFKNRFFRTLPNSHTISFVSKNVDYTDDATFVLFCANAVEGEAGIFTVAGARVNPAATPPNNTIVAGTSYFYALKRNDRIEKSPVFKAGTAVITKQVYVAPVKQAIVVTSIASPAAPVAGREYELSVIDQTPGHVPYPIAYFNYVAVAGDTHLGIMTKLTNMLNNTKLGQNANGKQFVTASIAADDITITAKDFGTLFKVVLGSELAVNASAATTVPLTLGSGSPAQVQLYEHDSDTFKGVTHQQTNSRTAQPADFGLPTSFVDPALNYTTFSIVVENTEGSPTPVEKHFRSISTLIFAPTGANFADKIATVLGV